MADYEGSVLRPPGFSAPKVVEGSEELLYAYNPAPTKKGGTVKAGAGVLRAGEPIKLDTDGTWVKATELDAEALNYKAVDASNEDHLINVIFGGVVNATVSGMSDIADKTALATKLGGTYNEAYGFIKF